jgi:thiosulfate/3-mercaptopyruvate sulfurtransferase
MLITVEGLAGALAGGAQRPALLDVRWELGGPPGRAQYAEGHIPGAVFVDLEHDLAGAPGPEGRHPLPSPAAFTAAMRVAGVFIDRPVVVYDAASAIAAARAWWLLRYHGHRHVTVLDGGLAAWVKAGHPVQVPVPVVSPGDFVARPGQMPVLDAAQAAQCAAVGVLLDARAPERFRGELEPVDAVAGHIPGAVNRPTAANVDGSGRFREPATLRSQFEAIGIRDGVAVGSYCGSGITAAHQVLALELAGYRAALYPGSWSEWITDPHRPVAGGGGHEDCP